MKLFYSVGLFLLSAACLKAVDLPAVDPDLPQPLDLGFADNLVMDSPFSRSVNLEESLQLTGIAYIDGKPVATVLNRTTKETFLVTHEPNAQGWTLEEVVAGTDLINSHVAMRIGPETITMHYPGQGGMNGGENSRSSSSKMANGKSKSSKVSVSSLLGQDGKKLYASLSSDGRSKFKEIVRSRIGKSNMSQAQSSAYAQKVFAKIKENDVPSSSSKTSKTPKAAKRQGT